MVKISKLLWKVQDMHAENKRKHEICTEVELNCENENLEMTYNIA